MKIYNSPKYRIITNSAKNQEEFFPEVKKPLRNSLNEKQRGHIKWIPGVQLLGYRIFSTGNTKKFCFLAKLNSIGACVSQLERWRTPLLSEEITCITLRNTRGSRKDIRISQLTAPQPSELRKVISSPSDNAGSFSGIKK
jgi:hypothetical protein